MYDQKINKLQERLNQVENEMSFFDQVYSELKNQSFHSRARNFITSLIRQRQRLVNLKASRKNNFEMLTIIDRLKVNLEAAPSKDIALARFFLHHEENIRAIIPGKYPSKRYETFISLREESKKINNPQLGML